MTQRKTTVVLFLALFLMSLPVSAQTFGEITGSVTDSTGAIIPGATVTIVNSATNVARSVETNESGNYSVPLLKRYNQKLWMSG